MLVIRDHDPKKLKHGSRWGPSYKLFYNPINYTYLNISYTYIYNYIYMGMGQN